MNNDISLFFRDMDTVNKEIQSNRDLANYYFFRKLETSALFF